MSCKAALICCNRNTSAPASLIKKKTKNNNMESLAKLNPTKHQQRRSLLLVFLHDYLYHLKSMKRHRGANKRAVVRN